ncbi:MAG: outer membrane lipoprotein-sorting protein [Acidobacteriota bacterium]|nr:outer membrane lipoprotein-sorting protein [Acidobacteriota bacterium]
MRAGVAVLAALLLFPLGARAADAQGVLAAARRQVKSADYRLSGRLVRVDGSGTRTTDRIAIQARWFPGVLRVLLDVTSPSTARAHVLLEMRPGGKSTILIAHPGDAAATPLPFAKWSDGPLGPGFSYEDFLEAQYFWAGQKDLGETKFGARICDQLRSTPGAADTTHFEAVESCVDPGSGFPVYVEKTLKGSSNLQEFTYFGLRQTRGVWWASQVESMTRGRAGSTLLIVDRGTPEAHLGLKDFNLARLTHF